MIPGGYLSGTRWIWYIVGESGVCGLILPSAVQCREGRREGRNEGRRERTLDCCFEKSQGKMEPTVAMSAKSNGLIATAHQPSTPLAHNFISFPFFWPKKQDSNFCGCLWQDSNFQKQFCGFTHAIVDGNLSIFWYTLMMMMMLLLPKVSWQ